MTEKTTIEFLVRDNKLPAAISELKLLLETLHSEHLNQLSLLESRYSKIKKTKIDGTETTETIWLEDNRLRAGFLAVLADVRQDIQARLTFYRPLPRQSNQREELRDFIETELSRKYESVKEAPDLNGHSPFIYFDAKEKFTDSEVTIMVMRATEMEDEKLEKHLKLIASLKHRNLIQLLEVNTEKHPRYLVTEKVRGVSLKRLLKNTGSMSLFNAKRLLLIMGDVMDYMRQKKLWHLGLRPSKIIIDHEMEPEISPFDIHEARNNRRSFRAFVEDARYCAPEHLFGKSPTDASGDFKLNNEDTDSASQFSLAALGFEMLTGEKLFGGKTVDLILNERQRFFNSIEHRKLRLAHPFLPPRVAAIFKKMMAENPEKRYEDLNSAMRDLQKVNVKLDKMEAIIFESYRRSLSQTENFADFFFERLFQSHLLQIFRPADADKTVFLQKFHIAVHLVFDLETSVALFEKATQLRVGRPNSRAEYAEMLDIFLKCIEERDPRWKMRAEIPKAWLLIRTKILTALDVFLPLEKSSKPDVTRVFEPKMVEEMEVEMA